FRYLKDTIHMGLWYPKDIGFELTASSYSDHAGCLDSRKSTYGGIQFLGGDKLVSWSSKKQDCTSMSSAEADHSHLVQSCPAFAHQAHQRPLSLHQIEEAVSHGLAATVGRVMDLSELLLVLLTLALGLGAASPDLEDSVIMRNEELNTIPEKESDEFIKSSVEDSVPIPSESEDTSGSDSEYILPLCDDFSPIDIPEEKAMTFSNPLFNSNDDFISSDTMQTPGSGISILMAVGTPSTGSGNLYCQWELSPGSGNALCILFPTDYAFFIIAVQTPGSGISILLANNQRKGNAWVMTTTPAEQVGYAGNKPFCNHYKKHHFGYCKLVYSNYGRTGHMKGHTRNHCPKRNDLQGEDARGHSYMIKDAEKNQGPNVVTVKLNTSYEIELADERVASTNTVLRGCTLNLVNHLFKIDLMPIKLGTFDVVIKMDWLVEQDVIIVCRKKRLSVVSGACNQERTKGEAFGRSPSEMKDLADQLQELSKEGFVCPGSSPWGASMLFVKKKDGSFWMSIDYRESKEEHEENLKTILELMKKEQLKVVHVDLAKIRAIKNWATPTTPTEGKDEEEAFQLLKQKLCCAPILALPEGTKDFVVYYDALLKGFGADLMQREKGRWIKRLSDYDCEIRYHPSKANMVADVLSQKEMEPLRVRPMKSYADVRRTPLEFEMGDTVMIRVGPVAYKLELSRELQGIHNTFHVSNLKKCLSDESLIPVDEI
nr:reverse transcriptase domain-containing protein [Tanacetum cinerariifolium]